MSGRFSDGFEGIVLIKGQAKELHRGQNNDSRPLFLPQQASNWGDCSRADCIKNCGSSNDLGETLCDGLPTQTAQYACKEALSATYSVCSDACTSYCKNP